MCNKCGNYYCNGNCVTQYVTPCYSCDPCKSSGPCPIKLDTQCIIYHKDNNQISNLTGLNLGNGSTLQLILDTIDTYIQQMKVANWTLTCLRAVPYTINTLQQFGQAVDTEICLLKADIEALELLVDVPLEMIESPTISWIQTGALDHTATGTVKVSLFASNQLTTLPDGLYAIPQTLSIDYTTKELGISDGNVVDLTSLVCGVSGFLGNQTADPTAIDGQYWFRTDLDQLKMRLNGVVRTITIV